MWQARHVADSLSRYGVQSELVPLVSSGDIDMRPIDGTRQVGVFTKRIQHALLDGEADIAVHSLKDLPTEVNPQLHLAAVPERERVNDALVSPASWTLAELPPEAKIGTGSRRRAAQLRIARADLQILPIRGNVQTRLQKLADGVYDAIILAQAGLLRLEMQSVTRTELALDDMLPAPGQGALGIEVRSDDAEARDILSQLDHPATRASVTAERTLLARLHGGCLAPIAAYAKVAGNQLKIKALVASTDGAKKLIAEASLPYDPHHGEQAGLGLGHEIAENLLAQGARELIQEAR